METLLIVDLSAIMHRAYHTTNKELRNRDGKPLSAINKTLDIFCEYIDIYKPNYIVATKDLDDNDLLRRKIYPSYKAHRPSKDIDFINQKEDIYTLLDALGVQLIEKKGYESDDLIATLCKKYKNNYEITVITSDKDLLQLVDGGKISVDLCNKYEDTNTPYYLQKFEIIEQVIDKLSVAPKDISNLFGLIGDSADNIPGVKGFGEVNTSKLINLYGTLENIYNNIENLPIQPKLKKALIEQKDNAYLSRELATLYSNIEGISIDVNRKYCYDNINFSKIFRTFDMLYLKNKANKFNNLKQNINHKMKIIKQNIYSGDFISGFESLILHNVLKIKDVPLWYLLEHNLVDEMNLYESDYLIKDRGVYKLYDIPCSNKVRAIIDIVINCNHKTQILSLRGIVNKTLNEEEKNLLLKAINYLIKHEHKSIYLTLFKNLEFENGEKL